MKGARQTVAVIVSL